MGGGSRHGPVKPRTRAPVLRVRLGPAYHRPRDPSPNPSVGCGRPRIGAPRWSRIARARRGGRPKGALTHGCRLVQLV
jgi:hypothetical protein